MRKPDWTQKALKMRDDGRRVVDIAYELGVSVHAVKKATTPGYAERERERLRKIDAERAPLRRQSEAYQAYQKAYEQTPEQKEKRREATRRARQEAKSNQSS